ncbi:hypothetical protein Tco_0456342 [Tanacetum coccineum]
MEVGTTTNNLTARLPILNPGDYDLWLMRIEHYFLMTDYSLWEVIKNGNKVLRRNVGTVKQVYEPTTAEEKHDRRNEMKARGTLLMALLKKDQLKFHSYQDAKLLMEAIEKRYGGNKESKKLEIQGEVINQEDMNSKLLRSLPSEWKYHALIWKNKAEIETISLDDLYNNLKIYEPELTGLGYDAATAASPAVESFVNLIDKSRSDKGYHSVPPPLTGNFIPHKPDLTFMGEIVKISMNNTSAPIIEDWNPDDENAPKQNPRGNQRNWNNLMSQRQGSDFKMTNKACYTCGSFEHLHYVCDKKVEMPVWKQTQKMGKVTRPGKLSTAGVAVNTVRPVNNVNTIAVNTVRPVNTANTKAVNTVRSVNTTASKPNVNI